MKKSAISCCFFLLLTCLSNKAIFAQKDKLLGHWNIIKIISDDTGPDGFEITLSFFENMYYKRIKAKADSARVTLDGSDSASIKKTAQEVYDQLKGSYWQLNGNGTIAASFEKGDIRKGKYTINEEEHSLTFKTGKNKDLYFYSFKDDVLQLVSENGSERIFLKKD